MRRLSACGPAMAAVISLSACAAGNGAVTERAPTVGEIRELTELSAPIETAAAQQARQRENVARADSLMLSTMHVEVVGPDATHGFRWLTTCAGPRCDLHDPVTGETDTTSLASSTIVRGDAEAIGSAHGITLLAETGRHMGMDRTSLGAWMEHGSFGLFHDRMIAQETGSTHLYALALGDLTGGPPAGSATWLGIMVGTPVAGDGRGERLVGAALLNYDLAAAALEAAFSGIMNIDRGTAHNIEAVTFSNLAVGPDGTFATGQSGTRIQSGFHGPGHAEATGIFEQSDIVGAFGATRQ